MLAGLGVLAALAAGVVSWRPGEAPEAESPVIRIVPARTQTSADASVRPDPVVRPGLEPDAAPGAAPDTFLAAPERRDDLPLPKSRVFEVLGLRLLSEPTDPDWSVATSGDIFELISETAPEHGFADIQVVCRSTLCRVQLAHGGEFRRVQFDDFSVAAIFHGLELRKAIEARLELEVASFDSGVVYGAPASLLYLRRTGVAAEPSP